MERDVEMAKDLEMERDGVVMLGVEVTSGLTARAVAMEKVLMALEMAKASTRAGVARAGAMEKAGVTGKDGMMERVGEGQRVGTRERDSAKERAGMARARAMLPTERTNLRSRKHLVDGFGLPP